ncbi:MAG: hypothetical protein WC901_03855 [Candidatus Margulisiibacteriota bacterium]
MPSRISDFASRRLSRPVDMRRPSGFSRNVAHMLPLLLAVGCGGKDTITDTGSNVPGHILFKNVVTFTDSLDVSRAAQWQIPITAKIGETIPVNDGLFVALGTNAPNLPELDIAYSISGLHLSADTNNRLSAYGYLAADGTISGRDILRVQAGRQIGREYDEYLLAPELGVDPTRTKLYATLEPTFGTGTELCGSSDTGGTAAVDTASGDYDNTTCMIDQLGGANGDAFLANFYSYSNAQVDTSFSGTIDRKVNGLRVPLYSRVRATVEDTAFPALRPYVMQAYYEHVLDEDTSTRVPLDPAVYVGPTQEIMTNVDGISNLVWQIDAAKFTADQELYSQISGYMDANGKVYYYINPDQRNARLVAEETGEGQFAATNVEIPESVFDPGTDRDAALYYYLDLQRTDPVYTFATSGNSPVRYNDVDLNNGADYKLEFVPQSADEVPPPDVLDTVDHFQYPLGVSALSLKLTVKSNDLCDNNTTCTTTDGPIFPSDATTLGWYAPDISASESFMPEGVVKFPLDKSYYYAQGGLELLHPATAISLGMTLPTANVDAMGVLPVTVAMAWEDNNNE